MSDVYPEFYGPTYGTSGTGYYPASFLDVQAGFYLGPSPGCFPCRWAFALSRQPRDRQGWGAPWSGCRTWPPQ